MSGAGVAEIVRVRSDQEPERAQACAFHDLNAARIGNRFEARGFFARIFEDRFDARDAAAQFGLADDQGFVDARCVRHPRFVEPHVRQHIRRGEHRP